MPLQRSCTYVALPPSQPLFDISISIAPQYKWIVTGNETRFNVHLINVGNVTTIDVTLKYWIVNENGQLIAEQQETRAVGKEDNFQVAIPVKNLDFGIYKVYVQISYGNNQVAIASDSFEVAKTKFDAVVRQALSYPYSLIFMGAIILVLALILIIEKTRKKREQNKIKKRLQKIYRQKVRQQKKLENKMHKLYRKRAIERKELIKRNREKIKELKRR